MCPRFPRTVLTSNMFRIFPINHKNAPYISTFLCLNASPNMVLIHKKYCKTSSCCVVCNYLQNTSEHSFRKKCMPVGSAPHLGKASPLEGTEGLGCQFWQMTWSLPSWPNDFHSASKEHFMHRKVLKKEMGRTCLGLQKSHTTLLINKMHVRQNSVKICFCHDTLLGNNTSEEKT